MKLSLTKLVICALVALASGRAEAAIVGGTTVAYGGHTYSLLDKGNWIQSEADAVTNGGHLVTVDDLAEQTFLVNTFLGGTHASDPLWIGLNDALVEGTFVWSSGTPVGYTNWNSGEPNDNGFNEDYVALNWHFARGENVPKGTWNDTPLAGTTGFGGNSDGTYFGILEVNAVSAVPEPASLIVWSVLGIAGAVAYRRRRKAA